MPQMHGEKNLAGGSLLTKLLWPCIGVVLLFIIDRISKWLALRFLPSEGIFVIPQTTGLFLEKNQGIAYSIPLPRGLLLIVVSFIIVVLMGLIIRAYRKDDKVSIISLTLILVGAISNFIDRWQYGFVVDLLVLTTWPVFNLADIMILVGAVWLILAMLNKKTQQKKGLTKIQKSINL